MREHIRTIKHITQPRPDGSGSYGWYFYCGKGVGVKVVYSTRYEQDEGCRTIKELRESPLWNAARREMRVLVKVEESGITPKPYCLKPVKRGYKWYPGIFMEHIEGVSLYSLYSSDKLKLCEAQDIRNKHQAKLLKYGIKLWDSNLKNIICKLNQEGNIVCVFVIDVLPL